MEVNQDVNNCHFNNSSRDFGHSVFSEEKRPAEEATQKRSMSIFLSNKAQPPVPY